MVDYFVDADDASLQRMGVSRALLPTREAWLEHLLIDHARPDERKDRLYIGWFCDGEQVGHSSVNKIVVGEEAFFHLHLWRPELRQSGLGTQFCRESIRIYFKRLRLERLWSEPHADNPAPNRALVKLGFQLIKRYRTVPGPINVEQDVNLYRLDRRAADYLR